VRLHDVTVTDPKAPNCNRKLGFLNPGAHRTYTCTWPGLTGAVEPKPLNHRNVAYVVGTSPRGVKVHDNDDAFVAVVYPTG
jgi:hypothetical protein